MARLATKAAALRRRLTAQRGRVQPGVYSPALHDEVTTLLADVRDALAAARAERNTAAAVLVRSHGAEVLATAREAGTSDRHIHQVPDPLPTWGQDEATDRLREAAPVVARLSRVQDDTLALRRELEQARREQTHRSEDTETQTAQAIHDRAAQARMPQLPDATGDPMADLAALRAVLRELRELERQAVADRNAAGAGLVQHRGWSERMLGRLPGCSRISIWETRMAGGAAPESAALPEQLVDAAARVVAVGARLRQATEAQDRQLADLFRHDPQANLTEIARVMGVAQPRVSKIRKTLMGD